MKKKRERKKSVSRCCWKYFTHNFSTQSSLNCTWHIPKVDTCQFLREGNFWLIFVRCDCKSVSITEEVRVQLPWFCPNSFFYSMQQRFSMRPYKMHPVRLAMRRSHGLLRSERRDRMRDVQFQLAVHGVDVDAHHIRQNSHGTLDRKYFRHRFLITALLRQK